MLLWMCVCVCGKREREWRCKRIVWVQTLSFCSVAFCLSTVKYSLNLLLKVILPSPLSLKYQYPPLSYSKFPTLLFIFNISLSLSGRDIFFLIFSEQISMQRLNTGGGGLIMCQDLNFNPSPLDSLPTLSMDYLGLRDAGMGRFQMSNGVLYPVLDEVESKEIFLNQQHNADEDEGHDHRRNGGHTKLCSRGHWRPHEDDRLRDLVAHYGPQNWNLIAEKLQGRSGTYTSLMYSSFS